jgi:transposase
VVHSLVFCQHLTEDYKREAVRLTETSGRTIAQVADDLGIGLSTLTRRKRRYREVDLLSGEEPLN